MQTHLSLYQHNLERLTQLRQEATHNALARQTGKKPSWLPHLQQIFLPSSLAPQLPCSSHAQATPNSAH